MTMRLAAMFCALCIGTLVYADDRTQVRLADLERGSQFEFSTADHVYRAQLIDPLSGEARLSASADGKTFTEPKTVFLLGATQGRAQESGGLMLVKMNQLQTGMCLELGLGSLDKSDRRLTEPLRSIRVD